MHPVSILQDAQAPFTSKEIAAGTDTHQIDANRLSTRYLTLPSPGPEPRLPIVIPTSRQARSPTFPQQIDKIQHVNQANTFLDQLPQRSETAEEPNTRPFANLSAMLTNPDRYKRISFAHSLRIIAYGTN